MTRQFNREDFALAMVVSSPLLVVDVETSGLHPYNDYVVGWVFCNGRHSIYVPVRHTGGGNIENAEAFEAALASAFRTRHRLGKRTIGHNLPFDLWFAAKQGVIIEGPLDDTMLRAGLIQDDARDYTLEGCANRHEVTPKKGEILYQHLSRFARKGTKLSSKLMAHYHKLSGDDPVAVEYAVGDGITTFELYMAQEPHLEALGLARVHRLEASLIPHIAAIRRRGIRIDEDYAPQALDRVRREVGGMLLKFPEGFNVHKRGDVIKHLKDKGINDFPLTPTFQESVDANYLETFPEGQEIIDLRILDKAAGGFIEPLVAEHVWNGRIHPDLVQYSTGEFGTHTGRFSCRMPNLQQWPKRNEKIGRLVRPLLVSDQGMTIAEFDVSQQEPRIAAHFSEEQVLIDGYNATPPIDYHTNTARLMGIERDFAKTLGLAIMNGMRAGSLSKRLHVPLGTAQGYVNSFFRAYPKLHAFMEGAPWVAQARGYVFTMLGRRAHLTGDVVHYAVSRVIQGSAADQMKAMLLRACEYADAHPQIQILMPIHDSLVCQSEDGFDTTEFHRVLEDNSEFYQIVHGEKVPMKCPLPLGVKTGKTWADASYGKEQK
jgi:DNA polymerase-1